MATQIDNTISQEIVNPFKQVGTQFIGTVLATYLNEYNVPKTITLYPVGDGSKLSLPSNLFTKTGQVVLSLQDNGAGNPVKVELNVTNYTTTQTTTSCGHTGSCGCGSTSSTTTETKHIINNVTKNVTDIQRQVEHFNTAIEQVNCAISDTLKDVHDELNLTTDKIRLDADKR